MFLLLSVARAEWFDYNIEEFNEYKKNSKVKPIFIIGWSPYCGHCINVPNETIIFKKLIENRTDFYATSIDASQGPEVYIPYTPYKAIVWGDNQDLWPLTRTKNATNWLEFIDEVLADHAKEVSIDEGVESLKNKSIASGGSAFYLTVGSENSRYLKEYRKLANEYFVYLSTFAYTFIPGSEPKLTVWTCFDCKYEFDKLDALENIIKEYKWSDFHQYEWKDWKEIKEVTPTLLLIVEKSPVNSRGQILEIQQYALMKISNKYCGKFRAGYITGEHGKDPLAALNIRFSDIPLVVYYYGNCYAEYLGKTTDLQFNDFINLSTEGHLCGKRYDNMKGEQKIINIEKEAPKTVKAIWWHRMIPGWKLTLYYVSFIFSFIAISPCLAKIDLGKLKEY